MNRKPGRLLLWTITLLPLLAAPVRANSITAYGVIITAMGNEGLSVQSTEKPDSGKSGESLFTTNSDSAGKGGVLVMPNGSGGVTVLPYDGIACPKPESNTPATGATGKTDEDGGTRQTDEPVDTPSGEVIELPPQVPDGDGIPIDAVGNGPQTPESDVIVTAVPGDTRKTPEPASLTLLAAAGVSALGVLRRRRK